MISCGHSLAVPQCSASNACTQYIFKVLVIPWFVRMYDAIMHERERVHYRTYMRRTMV